VTALGREDPRQRRSQPRSSTEPRDPKAAFDGAAQRPITITINPERVFEMTGLQFLRDWTLPHFYFHVVTAYNILRAGGIEIGKRDYVAPHGPT
jgi:hypothetical protein